MNFTQDLANLANALNLKKNGIEYHGACPLCGGKDRFWLKPGRTKDIVMSCRRGCQFKDLAKFMYDNGYATRDTDYKKQVTRKDDNEYCDMFIKIARGAVWGNYALSRDDKIKVNYLMMVVDNDRRKALLDLICDKDGLPKKPPEIRVETAAEAQVRRFEAMLADYEELHGES